MIDIRRALLAKAKSLGIIPGVQVKALDHEVVVLPGYDKWFTCSGSNLWASPKDVPNGVWLHLNGEWATLIIDQTTLEAHGIKEGVTIKCACGPDCDLKGVVLSPDKWVYGRDRNGVVNNVEVGEGKITAYLNGKFAEVISEEKTPSSYDQLFQEWDKRMPKNIEDHITVRMAAFEADLKERIHVDGSGREVVDPNGPFSKYKVTREEFYSSLGEPAPQASTWIGNKDVTEFRIQRPNEEFSLIEKDGHTVFIITKVKTPTT